MDFKVFCVVMSTALSLIALGLYLKELIYGSTKPHPFTWLIWSVTQGTATVAMWNGGSGYGALPYTITTVLVFLIFLATISYGSKDITKTDVAFLVGALLAIVLWWQLDSAVLPVLIVSLIDILGYMPTYRKSYKEPWSESVVAWSGHVLSGAFALAAMDEHNLLTVTYVSAISIASLVLIVLCLVRRQVVVQKA